MLHTPSALHCSAASPPLTQHRHCDGDEESAPAAYLLVTTYLLTYLLTYLRTYVLTSHRPGRSGVPARPCPQACRASSLGSEHLTTCGISLDATSLRGPFSPSDVDIRSYSVIGGLNYYESITEVPSHQLPGGEPCSKILLGSRLLRWHALGFGADAIFGLHNLGAALRAGASL
jgi:hypothetical protein